MMGSQALISSHFNSDCNFTLQTSHLSFVVGMVSAGLFGSKTVYYLSVISN